MGALERTSAGQMTGTMSENSRQTVSAFDTGEELTQAVWTLAEGTESAIAAEGRPSVDELFDLLADPGRRYVLTYLLQAPDYVTCTDLVDHVVAATDHSMTDGEFRTRVTAQLTQTHLPKLADAGLVDYNVERQIVSPTETTVLSRPYLRLALAQQQLTEDDS